MAKRKEKSGIVWDGEETREKHYVRLEKKRPAKAISYVATGPYPAFPTDDQSLLLPVLAKANGVSTIEEKVFENRFRLIGQLHKMGANIDFVSNRARIIGVTKASRGKCRSMGFAKRSGTCGCGSNGRWKNPD